jgi:hypothetical protein
VGQSVLPVGPCTLRIFDCRSQTAALANKIFLGKGVESEGHYCQRLVGIGAAAAEPHAGGGAGERPAHSKAQPPPGAGAGEGGQRVVALSFLRIANIHAVRESHALLLAAAGSRRAGGGERTAGGSFLAAVQESQWLRHVSDILAGSCAVAAALEAGAPCVVHCSDGWDRTAQVRGTRTALPSGWYCIAHSHCTVAHSHCTVTHTLTGGGRTAQVCALAQLLLDPHYRTTEGFVTLVEKEWACFGHMFALRGGQEPGQERKEESPVFLQVRGTLQLHNRYVTHTNHRCPGAPGSGWTASGS